MGLLQQPAAERLSCCMIFWGHVQITLSDIRDSILANAGKRLRESGGRYKIRLWPISPGWMQVPGARQWPLVLADMPCTGSGTWARTPEQSYYFDGQRYVNMQKGRQRSFIQ